MTEDGAATRPNLTLSQAAVATNRHRNTVRNALDAGRFPNAFREGGDGPWVIPVTDLLAAGFPVNAPQIADDDDVPEVSKQVRDGGEVQRLRDEVDDLRRRLAVAEALAGERAKTLELMWAMFPPMLPAKSRWPWGRNKPSA